MSARGSARSSVDQQKRQQLYYSPPVASATQQPHRHDSGNNSARGSQNGDLSARAASGAHYYNPPEPDQEGDANTTYTTITTTTTTTTQQQQEGASSVMNSSENAYGTLLPADSSAGVPTESLDTTEEAAPYYPPPEAFEGDPDVLRDTSSYGGSGRRDRGAYYPGNNGGDEHYAHEPDDLTDSYDTYYEEEERPESSDRSFTHPVTFGGLLMTIPFLTTQIKKWSFRAPTKEIEKIVTRTLRTTTESVSSVSTSGEVTVSSGKLPLHGVVNAFLGWMQLPSLEETRSSILELKRNAATKNGVSSTVSSEAVVKEVVERSTRIEPGTTISNSLPLPLLIGGLSVCAVVIARYVVRPSLPSVREYQYSRVYDETARVASGGDEYMHGIYEQHAPMPYNTTVSSTHPSTFTRDASGVVGGSMASMMLQQQQEGEEVYHDDEEPVWRHHSGASHLTAEDRGDTNDNDQQQFRRSHSGYSPHQAQRGSAFDPYGPDVNPEKQGSQKLRDSGHHSMHHNEQQEMVDPHRPELMPLANTGNSTPRILRQQFNSSTNTSHHLIDSGRVGGGGGNSARTHASDRHNVQLDSAPDDIHTSRSPIRLPPLRTQQAAFGRRR